MSLQIGIVGLPNAGKSTLFNALTRGHAAVAPYPFTTIDPNIGIASIPDQRLERVGALIHPEKVIPATVEFVDIAGLVRGAHRGEGLGNQFLGHIRNTHAVAVILRAFRDPDVAHVQAAVGPQQDLETLQMELALADVATLDRRLEKVRGQAKAKPREFEGEIALLEQARAALNQGQSLPPNEREGLAGIDLLTLKPKLYVINVGEEDLPEGGPLAQGVLALAATQGVPTLILSAQVEAVLVDWPPEEAADYRRELGLEQSGLERLIVAGYGLLDLISYITATGTTAVRAWSLQRGGTAWDAAGQVHSDMQRGFIRAEVIGAADLLATGSFAAARERGLLRLEGRDYVVQDGDVMHFRFNA
ncbi:MAG: redox-regulated ATPase YchF [Chloroflexi bacterium]|nr:redox-regulated ATPase YchF [Chloroflexota bacterium]